MSPRENEATKKRTDVPLPTVVSLALNRRAKVHVPTTQLGDTGENPADETLVILVLRGPLGLSPNKSFITFIAAVWVDKVEGSGHRPPKAERMHKKSRVGHERNEVTDRDFATHRSVDTKRWHQYINSVSMFTILPYLTNASE